ncbi:hypothetical protein [Litoribacter populi]|uniref:hypothetical protein n=1 Tax=Litoribacter populi TaxID=2598460 RepID=UPI00117D9A5B|nr:hypothetical protein [Litoribacter populi]
MSLLKSKLVFLFLFLCFALSFESFAQREIYLDDKPPLKDRMYYGGNFSLQFGSVTFIDVSPLAGVMITERYSAGVGATYQYMNFRWLNTPGSSVFGGRVFNRFNVLPNFFVHGEFETLNAQYVDYQDRLQRDWVPGLFVGGGYFSPFGPRGGINISILYNLMYDNLRSPYAEPYVIRAGFLF